MTNREKYFLKRDEYDTMMAINFRMHKNCPIEVIGAEKPKCMPSIYGLAQTNCDECIQNWLNQEADQSRPQWQDAMMKNFLRKE